MMQLTLKYTGEDIVIPKEQIEALGIQPGEDVLIAAASAAPPDPAASRQEIESILNELARAAPGAAKDSERELRKLLDQLKPGD